MSVDPWMEACPRRARMPPPGRPMLPSSACRMAAVRMYWTPTVCWVQPTLYTNEVVRSRPEFEVSRSHTLANASGGTPQACSTISGVYRAKCRLSTWKTQRGWSSDSCTGRGPDHGPLIAPGRQVIPVTFHVKPGEDAVEVLGVGEVLGEDRGRVGVGDH